METIIGKKVNVIEKVSRKLMKEIKHNSWKEYWQISI